jgi:acyl-[acyl carrier protein]--UDP-N-acetylglucosamine O-acyltransferase
MHAIHAVYSAVFHGKGGTVTERLAKVRKEVKNNKYAMDAIDFIENRSKRGIGTSDNAE